MKLLLITGLIAFCFAPMANATDMMNIEARIEQIKESAGKPTRKN